MEKTECVEQVGRNGQTEPADLTEEIGRKLAAVDYSIRLPESEFEVMMAIWDLEPPVSTNRMMQVLSGTRNWKAPTLISFLRRLEEKGYLLSFKRGKERLYIPIAEKEPYIRRVTEDFVAEYHGGSFVRLLDSLFAERGFGDAEIDELLGWLKTR